MSDYQYGAPGIEGRGRGGAHSAKRVPEREVAAEQRVVYAKENVAACAGHQLLELGQEKVDQRR